MNNKIYLRQYAKEHYQNKASQRRATLFEILGEPACKRCGFSDSRALQIDHINGGGSKERKKKTLLRQIQENPKNFQILCANCNWIKRVENREVTGRTKVY